MVQFYDAHYDADISIYKQSNSVVWCAYDEEKTVAYVVIVKSSGRLYKVNSNIMMSEDAYLTQFTYSEFAAKSENIEFNIPANNDDYAYYSELYYGAGPADYNYFILTSLDLYYDAFNVPGIQETKLKILISEHIIRMNPESLKYMRDEYPSAVLFFIKRNIGKYADIMNEDLFDQLELLEILSWGIPDSIKLSLLSFAENGISIIGKNYSLQVCAYILTNNLLQEDIIHLYLSYETLPTQIQEIVFEHAKKDVHEIILNPTTAAKLLKEKLLATSAISIEDRIALFAAIIPHIEQADTRKYLSMLGLDNFSKIFDSHSKPKFEITSQNQHILDAFKLKGWIYEYVEDESHPGYYKIRRRVPKKIENV